MIPMYTAIIFPDIMTQLVFVLEKQSAFREGETDFKPNPDYFFRMVRRRISYESLTLTYSMVQSPS